MAYATGSAATLAELRTAIFGACTANGWTNDGDVIYRGGCYARLQVVTGSLHILGGNGVAGGDVTFGGPYTARIGDLSSPAELAYPLTYHIFINTNPDEVYVVIKYSSIYFQWLAWGKSNIALPGTGNWYGASLRYTTQYLGMVFLTPTSGGHPSGGSSGGLWWTANGTNPAQNCFIHHGIDGIEWSNIGSVQNVGGSAAAIIVSGTLVSIAPNAWNSEAPLIPIPVIIGRPSSRYSLVAQPRHARYTRLDSMVPEQIVTIATDQWMIFPWFSRNTAERDASLGGAMHSGTLGWAIRYTP